MCIAFLSRYGVEHESGSWWNEGARRLAHVSPLPASIPLKDPTSPINVALLIFAPHLPISHYPLSSTDDSPPRIAKNAGKIGEDKNGLLVLGEGYMLDPEGKVVVDEEGEELENGADDLLLDEALENASAEVEVKEGEGSGEERIGEGEQVVVAEGGDAGEKAIEGVKDAKEEAKGMLVSMKMQW